MINLKRRYKMKLFVIPPPLQQTLPRHATDSAEVVVSSYAFREVINNRVTGFSSISSTELKPYRVFPMSLFFFFNLFTFCRFSLSIAETLLKTELSCFR